MWYWRACWGPELVGAQGQGGRQGQGLLLGHQAHGRVVVKDVLIVIFADDFTGGL